MSLPTTTLSILICLSAVLLAEVKLDSLKIGSKEFKDVTLSLEKNNRVKIVHEAGISRIQASELPADIQLKIGWQSEEEKVAVAKALLDADYPMSEVSISNENFSDNRVRDELNKILDANPNAKVFSLTIEVTENPRQQQFIKIIFDKENEKLFHLRRIVPSFGGSANYDLVSWTGIKLETLNKGIPWMDDDFRPLGKSDKGIAPLNLEWRCNDRPEIADWP